MIDCIILAGGKGTRLKKTISHVPKPLAPINGRAFLDFLIHQLKSFKEINNIILAIGYKKEQIIEKYQNESNIKFSIEEKPLGTGGAIKNAINKTQTEYVLILNGDSYISFSLENFYKFHQEKKADISLIYRKETNVNRYGQLIIDEKTQKITSFDEKKKTSQIGYINAGVYLIKRELFEDFSLNAFSLENDFFSNILKTKHMFAYKNSGIFIDIGTKESYFKAQEILKNT